MGLFEAAQSVGPSLARAPRRRYFLKIDFVFLRTSCHTVSFFGFKWKVVPHPKRARVVVETHAPQWRRVWVDSVVTLSCVDTWHPETRTRFYLTFETRGRVRIVT